MVAFSMIIRATFVSAVCFTAPAYADDDMDLPDIDSVLQEAAGTQDDFAAQVATMQEHVQQQQEKSTAELAVKKAEFEKSLAEQSQRNLAVKAENEELRNTKENLQKGNEALLADTKRVRGANRLLRSALVALSPKMKIANEFLGQALRVTDSNNTDALKVLEPSVPEPTLDYFLDVVREANTEAKRSKKQKSEAAVPETDGGKMSLLDLTRRLRGPKSKEAPEDFVPVLTKGLDNLAQAQEEGLARLQAQYLAQMEVGQKTTDGLMAEQQKLKDHIAGLQTRQGELHSAKALVLKTHEELQKRVEGIRVFVVNADKTVAANINKARAMLGNAAPAQQTSGEASAQA